MEKRRIYCDNAATTYVSAEVLTEMLPTFTTAYANPASGHLFGQDANKLVEQARERMAKAFKARSNEIFFTSGGTESNNIAIFGIAEANASRGKHVIVSQIEHPAILESAKKLEEDGFEVSYLPVNGQGLVSLADLLHEIRKGETILVSIMMANNEVGTIQNIRAIANICRDENIVFHTDAVQAVGAVSIDVNQMGIDAMTISGHKIYGPKGIGALYLKTGVAVRRQVFGGGQERGIRSGTHNVPGIVGLGKAVEVAVRDMNVNNQKTRFLRDYFIKQVQERIEGVHLNGHPVQRLSNNANLSFEAIEGEALLVMLSLAGVAVSTGSACNSAKLEKSHVLRAMGVDEELAQSSIRFSFNRSITKDEIDYVVAALEKAVKRLREYSPVRLRRK